MAEGGVPATFPCHSKRQASFQSRNGDITGVCGGGASVEARLISIPDCLRGHVETRHGPLAPAHSPRAQAYHPPSPARRRARQE